MNVSGDVSNLVAYFTHPQGNAVADFESGNNGLPLTNICQTIAFGGQP
jgi:hypothetical protein